MFQVEIDPPFRRPALVVALDGWVNAGQAGTLAAETIAGDGPVVARFDPDRLYDFRMVRPVVEFEDGVIKALEWPRLVVSLKRCVERDLLVLSGTEPNWNWSAFASSVAGLAEQFGITQYVGIGGVPWATPHTRPTTVIATAGTAGDLPADAGAPEGRLRVPAAAVSVIEWTMSRAGLPSVGFWARVPNYVGGNYPDAAAVLVQRVADHLQVELATVDLVESAAARRRELDEVAEQRSDVQNVIAQLEQLHDSTQPVSGEQLAAEIERFLKDQ